MNDALPRGDDPRDWLDWTAMRQSLASDFVNHHAGGYPFIETERLTVTALDSADDANQFVVTIRYDARGLPIWNLFPGLPMPSTSIVRSSTIRIGGI